MLFLVMENLTVNLRNLEIIMMSWCYSWKLIKTAGQCLWETICIVIMVSPIMRMVPYSTLCKNTFMVPYSTLYKKDLPKERTDVHFDILFKVFAWCQQKGHTYLSKPAIFSCRFVYVCVICLSMCDPFHTTRH